MRNLLRKRSPQVERTHSPTGRPLWMTVEWWFDPSNTQGWWAKYQPELHAAHLRRLHNLPEPQDPWERDRDIRQKARDGQR